MIPENATRGYDLCDMSAAARNRQIEEVYVVDAVRTPIGKLNGVLSTARPDDLAAHVIRALMSRNPNLAPDAIEEVIFGAANQAGEDNRNVARMAALLAGLPITVSGATVNRLCASGLQSIADAYRAISAGDGDIYIAGGAESMTRAPFSMGKAQTAFQRHTEIYDTALGWRFTNPKLADMYHPFTMGETAENVAERWGISREEQDAFAMNSQEKYFAAEAEGKFNAERVPVEVVRGKETVVVDKDEQPRASSMEALAKLKPAFRHDGKGSVTAGNSSGLNDGAAALLLMNEAGLKAHNLTPIAKILSVGFAGVEPAIMGVGPIPASRKALQRAGLTAADLDLIELNEAFASQSLACVRDLELDPAKVNVNGGAIAIGHPLGCSGSRISATLLHEMVRRQAKYGLATMCIGVGQGAAVVYERV